MRKNAKSLDGNRAKADSEGAAGKRIGISLGAGGPMGGIYQIGALRAIDEALEGLDLNDLDCYIGVNSGGFVAANLANQITPAQMCRIFVRSESDIHPFHPQVFYRPAVSEYLDRARAVPGLLIEALRNLMKNPSDQSLLECLTVIGEGVPLGVFDNSGFQDYVCRAFSSLGRTNDFNLLRRNLLIIAADLETGRTVRFGEEGQRDIPISKAIQCSMASPGVYVPVAYRDRFYVDGTMNKGLHASIAFEKGCDVVLAINPVVPVDVHDDRSNSERLRKSVTKSGMGHVLAQSYRTMVHSRLHSGLKNMARNYPKGEMFLFEPDKKVAQLFLSSVFSDKVRKKVCEEAYQATRKMLLAQADELEASLGESGVVVNRDVLEDPGRTIKSGLYGETIPGYSKIQSIANISSGPKSGEGVFEKVSARVAAWF